MTPDLGLHYGSRERERRRAKMTNRTGKKEEESIVGGTAQHDGFRLYYLRVGDLRISAVLAVVCNKQELSRSWYEWYYSTLCSIFIQQAIL